MSHLKPETRCKQIKKEMERLATECERFCPNVRRISLQREDFDLLRKKPDLARATGFIVMDDRLTYRGFEIKPTDINRREG